MTPKAQTQPQNHKVTPRIQLQTNQTYKWLAIKATVMFLLKAHAT